MNLYGYVLSCDQISDVPLFQDFQKLFVPMSQQLRISENKLFIGEQVYNRRLIIEEIDIILRLAQREWHYLQTIALNGDVLAYEEMMYSRELINKSFSAITESLLLCEYPSQKARYASQTLDKVIFFTNTVLSFSELSEEFVIKLSALKESDTRNPVYQYFHTFLEIHYYTLVLHYICGSSKIVLENKIETIIINLVVLARRSFQRQITRDVFGCPCVKNIWLLIQLFCEKTRDPDFFWKIFNKKLETEDSLFTLWLLKDVANLHSYNTSLRNEENHSERIRENYELIQFKLKPLLLKADSDMLMEILKSIEPLICGLWLKQGSIQTYQIIWDYYSKRLNVSKRNYTNSTALDLVELLDIILFKPKECKGDFEKFISMLICQLQSHPEHWGKMKGRIYSQLGPNKLKELSETGIIHVMLLFIALSAVGYEEVTKKVVSIFDTLPPEKKNTPLVWNVYITFNIIQVRNGHSLGSTAPSLLSLLQEASADNKHFRLIKGFITNFEHLLKFSGNMQLDQSLFLNSWISKYLSTCYYTDLNLALDVLAFTLDKVGNPDCWSLWMAPFKEHVYPALKLVSSTHNAPGSIGKIAGKLCLLIPHLANEIFAYFTNENILSNILSEFLIVVLRNYPNSYILNEQQEAQVIICWVKICLLTMEAPESLTQNVLKFDLFPVALKSHINSSKDPIYALIEFFGSDIKHHSQSSFINKLCELSFGHLDKWLVQYISQGENEAIICRIYTYLSLAFLHCGTLLYSRNKSSCPLTKLTQCLLMPNDLLIGKNLHEYVVNAVKNTWHLFYEAMVKLRAETDMFVERMLRDMITKYMKYFSTSESPILKCLENDAVASVLLEKLCSSYFKHPVKEPDANLLKVLKILTDIIKCTTSIQVLKLIVTKTFYGLCEVVIFHKQRSTAISLIATITCSPLYPQIKAEFRNEVNAITVKHMAFNTINYFQLMMILAKFVPNDIKELLGNVKQQVINVERLRSVGFDRNLRLHFEKLESAVKVTQ
ncbi:protein MMS22-like [Leptinotarsa decemlineata]|uniref:protein MMS22-like n=1 Tax=Leptinotarsa decemlineata TaxID=7539 RepID=UPI003D307BAB